MIALNVVTYNEAHRIVECLESAAQLCDEFVVVDQDSTDGTADIARQWGARVILDNHWGFCEASRPLAAESTESDWILLLDADESLIADQVPLLRKLVAQSDWPIFLGYRHFVDGIRQHADGEHYRCRLFKKGTVSYGVQLHSRVLPLRDEHNVREVPGAILHTKSLEEWQLDADRYAALEGSSA